MPNGKVYDPLVGLWMTPNWENTFERIETPTKLHQYRFNGNDPVNAEINRKPPSTNIEWLNAIGYNLNSMAPQFNDDLWKIPKPWTTNENFIHQSGLTIESGFLSHLKERRLSNHENFETSKQSELRSNSSPFSQLRIGSSADPAFGKGIIVSRTLEGQAIVSSVPAANAIYRDVYTSVFNRTLLVPLTFIVHNSLHDVFHFVKEDSWRATEDRQQLKRLQGQVNTTFHDVVNKDNTSGNNNYLDVKIHGTHAIINLRYGTTVDKEKTRLMHHAKLQAVRKAWTREKELLADGLLTSTEWNQADMDEILKQGYSNFYDCQYIHDVNIYPELAEDPYNIKFVKKKTNQAKRRRRRELNNEVQPNEFER
jgi:hypothetical protein